jgi:preprotein translocase subunit SecG
VRVKSAVPSLKSSAQKGTPFTVNMPGAGTNPIYSTGHKVGKAVSGEIFGMSKTVFLVGLFGILILVLAIIGNRNKSTSSNSESSATTSVKKHHPLEDITGSWETGETCGEQYMTITTSGDHKGTMSHNYADPLKNKSEPINYSQKNPNNIYLIVAKASPTITVEYEYKKLNDRQIRLWRLVIYPTANSTDEKALVLNGKDLDTLKDTYIIDKCW